MSEKKEYIEREEMNKLLKTIVSVMPYGNMFQESTMKAANAIPAADVEPVVRGEWKETGGYGMFHQPIIECSVCGDQIEETKRRKALKRCPNCGAHMERSGSGE